jgi:hypothetical protein
MEAIVVAVIAGLFGLAQIRMSKKISETHRQVTVNHHSSENPTILDKLDDLERAIRDHLNWHLKKDD